MAAMGGVVEGVASNAAWAFVRAGYRKLTRGQISITSPRAGENLKDPKPLGTSTSYIVRGKLSRLPKDHRIWLLIETQRTADIWPQGFQAVQHDPQTGEWEGRINPSEADVLIHAVVAPPSSDDFFRYFQQVGDRLEKWVPLRRVPPECINRFTVQARKP